MIHTKDFHEGKIEAFKIVLSYLSITDTLNAKDLEGFLLDNLDVQEQVLEDEQYSVDYATNF